MPELHIHKGGHATNIKIIGLQMDQMYMYYYKNNSSDIALMPVAEFTIARPSVFKGILTL